MGCGVLRNDRPPETSLTTMAHGWEAMHNLTKIYEQTWQLLMSVAPLQAKSRLQHAQSIQGGNLCTLEKKKT